jgi:hypothetical protein
MNVELASLLEEQEDATRKAHQTIGIGEEILERARSVAHEVEERVHHVLGGNGPRDAQTPS